jgi:hypothetical protein
MRGALFRIEGAGLFAISAFECTLRLYFWKERTNAEKRRRTDKNGLAIFRKRVRKHLQVNLAAL